MNIAQVEKNWEGLIVEGRLPLRQWLGGSDHSSVFLTEIAGPGSKAVIKIFSPGFFRDPDRRLSLWRNASQFESPALLRVLDGGNSEIDGVPFFFVVMDFAEEDLSQILPHRPLTPTEITDLLPPVLDALSYLHRQEFVHGRVQPSNIMASGSDLRFPVDRIYAIGENKSDAQTPTPYDPPEGGNAPAGDIWSLGVTLLSTLRQEPPTANQLRAPGILNDIPEPLHSIIRGCLEVDPGKRCSLADIRTLLEKPPIRIIEVPGANVETPESKSETQTVSRPAHAERSPETVPELMQERVKEEHSRWRVLGPLAAVVLIGAIFLGQKFFGHHNQPASPPATETAQPASPPSGSSLAQTHPSPDTATTTPRSAGKIIHRVIPDVPVSARRTIHGTIKVSVEVNVDSSGKVTAAKLTTPGPSRYFAGLALKSAHQWSFQPPQVNGQAVASAWILHYLFARTSTDVRPAELAHR